MLKASCASWAIKFAASLEGIVTVLSGMSNIEQVEDNISFMKDFNGFNEEEKKVIENAREALNSIPLIACTSCDYCAKVCPMNIGISGSFAAMNINTLYGKDSAMGQFGFRVKGNGLKFPSECIECGACEEVCPQRLPIRDLLKDCAKVFG